MARFPAGSVPNYAAWGPDGSLYVTDYAKPIVWRLAPGGGDPQPWLTDPHLDGGPVGTTGVALAPDRSTLIVGQQSEAGLGAGDPATGRLLKWRSGPMASPAR